MIWIFGIPTIVVVIAAMLMGSIKPGGIIVIAGWIAFILGLIFLRQYIKERENDFHGYRVWAPLFLISGVLLWLFGGWFGEHTIFEFLFGVW